MSYPNPWHWDARCPILIDGPIYKGCGQDLSSSQQHEQSGWRCLEQAMEMSPRRNKEDLPMRVCSCSTMAFYRTGWPRLPVIFTFFVLIFRCSSSSVLHCRSSFFWCVLRTTMPTTLAAFVGLLHLTPNPLFPTPYKWNCFFHTAYCSWTSPQTDAATASKTLVTVYQTAWCHIPGCCNLLC